MFIRSIFHGNQRGDSIIEVLIAILVISAVLGGAYASASSNQKINQDAQDRTSALKLMEGQLEQMKSLALNNPSAIFGGSAPASFCIDSSGAVVPSTSGSCTMMAASGSQPIFKIAVTHTGNLFTVSCDWPRFGAIGNQTANLKYRLYQG
jgi:Tfp pilus assembly protein PilV